MSWQVSDIPETEADALAAVHARCFHADEVWSTAALRASLQQPDVIALQVRGADGASAGFILGRVAADEAEILTLAVDPAYRRQQLGRQLVTQLIQQAQARGAARLFLEVADNNQPAQALYAAAGFVQVGLRPAYYASGAGALLLACDCAAKK